MNELKSKPMEEQLVNVSFFKYLYFRERLLKHKYIQINDTSFIAQSWKINKSTSIIFYASWDNNIDLELVTKHLTYKGPVKEASLHYISYKLSKPRSQLKFFPTFIKQ